MLENLGSSMEAVSGMRPIGGEDLASSQPSGTGDVHEQGTKLNDDEQEKVCKIIRVIDCKLA